MNAFQQLIDSEKPVLVDFFAEWCNPCQTMTPILKEVKKQVGDAVTIVKIDIDKNPVLASAYQVMGVPMLILFRKGSVLWKQAGLVTSQELVKLLKGRA